jgi:hypothetical protein
MAYNPVPLNTQPDGSPSPTWSVTARTWYSGETCTQVLQEWWYEGRQVTSIEESAKDYFYQFFDKQGFDIISIDRTDAPTKPIELPKPKNRGYKRRIRRLIV